MQPRSIFLAAAVLVAAGCTPNDSEMSAVNPAILESEDQSVAAGAAMHPSQDPARTNQCAELTGQAMRDCLERAQYMPENAQGMAVEASTRRQDPNQIDPALRARAAHDDEMRNPNDPGNAMPRVGVEGQIDETTAEGTDDDNPDQR